MQPPRACSWGSATSSYVDRQDSRVVIRATQFHRPKLLKYELQDVNDNECGLLVKDAKKRPFADFYSVRQHQGSNSNTS